MSKLITQIKRLALALCFVTPLVSWAANSPTATVDGTSVTISNESGAGSWDNATLLPLSNYQNKTFTVPAIGTDVPAGTILKVSSVSFAKSTSATAYPAKIKIAGCVSAAATVTSSGFTTANADKITYSFGDGICLLKAGTANQIAFLDANGVQLTSGGSFAFRLGYNAYQFVGSVVWSSKVPIVEIVAEVVDGYVDFEASIGNGWGFESGSGSGKVYISGYKNYMLTSGSNEKEIVLTDGTYGYAFDIKDANSMSQVSPNQVSDWSKISGDGTLTTASANAGRVPVLLIRDATDFVGSINATASAKLIAVFCGAAETFDENVLYNKLFANYKGSVYVTGNSDPVTVPAGKTWTANYLVNEGSVTVDGTFSGSVVNSGALTLNGSVTGEISNSGTVKVNAGATLASFTTTRDFTGYTVDSTVPVSITLTAEEYGKGAATVTGATDISSITVYAPDGTTSLGTLTPDGEGAAAYEGTVSVSGKACWYDWEMNGNLDGSGVNTDALTYDSGSAANNFYNSAMLYTYRHPYTSVTFPATWTAVVRCTVPKVVNGTVITFGTRYTSFIGLIAGDDPETEMKLVRYNSGDEAYSVLASMPIVDGTSAQHVYVFSVENNSAVKVYCDGSLVLDDTFETFSLGGGIQIGSAHGGVAGGLVRMWAGDTYDGLTTSDLEEARVDCVRLYDYSLSAEQVAALSVEFHAVKLYRATVEADASTTWGALSWSPSWDGGNSQSKVILTAEGGATVALPASITADEVQLVIPAESTVALTGPGTLAVTEPVDVSGGTLSLSGTLTLDEDLVISGSVVFDGVTTDGTGGLKLANGATVGVANGSAVVTPLGTYTLAEGTVVDSDYTDDGVKLIPLASAKASLTYGNETHYYSTFDNVFNAFMQAAGQDDTAILAILDESDYSDSADYFAQFGYIYDATAKTLVKAMAKVLVGSTWNVYDSLAGAVAAVEDGGTVYLQRASSEEIALNDKAITLSETANFSGTLTGNGTLTFAAFRNNPSITFDNWTGTVVLPSFAADGTKLNNYGVAGSTVVLKGITGGWFTETSTQKMDVAPVLQLDGNVTIKGFSTSWDYTFAELAGTGNFVLDPTDNNPKSVTITKVAEDFSGIITNNTDKVLTITTLAREAETSTDVGTKLLDIGGTGEIVVGAVTIGGEPADVYLVYEEDGVYVGVPPVEINPSAVVINYNSYATLSVVGGSLEDATYGWTMYTNGVACSSMSGPVKISTGKTKATVKVYSETTAFDNVVAKVAITNGEDVIEREATITVADVAAKIGETVYTKAQLDNAIADAISSGEVLEHYLGVSTTISKGQTLKTKKLAERNGSASVKAAASTTAGEAWAISKSAEDEDGVITWSVETETPIFEFTSEDGETVEYLAAPKNAVGTNKLLSDATITKQFSVTKDGVVLDLNGHALTSTYSSTTAGAIYVNVISPAPAALTVKDSVGGGSIAAASAHSVFMLGNNGQLTVEGGSFTGKHIVYGSKTTSVATITGGTFTATDAGFTLNMFDSARGTITVTGGTFTGFNPANNAAEGAGTNFVPNGYVSTETSTGVWTVAKSGIDPEDPISTQEVEIETEGKTQEQIEAAAIAAASVTVPDAAKAVVEESTYKNYFTYTVTPTAKEGVYEVAIADLKEEVVFPTEESDDLTADLADVLDVAAGADVEITTAKPGLYYSIEAATDLGFTEPEEGARTLATGTTVSPKKPAVTGTPTAVFYRVKVSTTQE